MMDGDKMVEADLDGCGSFLACVFVFVIVMIALTGIKNQMCRIEEKVDSIIKTKEIRNE